MVEIKAPAAVETPEFRFVAVLIDGSDEYRIYVQEEWVSKGSKAEYEAIRSLPHKRKLRNDIQTTFQPSFMGGTVITSGMVQVFFGTDYRELKELVCDS